MDAYETSIYTAVLISAVFLLCLAVFYVVSVVRHQRKYMALQRRYFLDEIGLLEKERTRIARDLHDELAPLLSLTKFQVDSLSATKEAERAGLQKASVHLETVMLRLGEIAVNLNASKLVQKGFYFALRDFLQETESVSRLRIDFAYSVQQTIAPEAGIHLYRIAQEVVHNTIKHAHATVLEVHVKEEGDRLLLFFRDNGRGFLYRPADTRHEGIGLQSIRNRTGLLRGRLQCLSAPGEGTSYLLEIPFKPHLL